MSRKTDKIEKQLNEKKAAIYIRVSTTYQIDKDSLKVQNRELIAYCEMVLGIKDYEIFEDPGYSAKNTDRPAYQQMMRRLRTGEFTHLLVWKIDRISRNLLDFAQMHLELKNLGITFVSKNEQFDTSTAIGEAMLKIILVFAELERNMTSERVTAVMLSRATNGQWNGGRVPYGYGYDKETKTFYFVPDEAAIVKDIFNTYEERQSVVYITRRLNEKGINTLSGKQWSATGVHHILSSIFYKGDYRYNVTAVGKGYKRNDESEWITYKNHHEPMISDEQFDRVQFLLKRNRRGGWADGETHLRDNIHIFAGLVKCDVCGSNMSATLDRRRANGWRPSLYACRNRRNNKECNNKYISDVTLGPFIFQYISNLMKARNSIGKRTTLQVFENKILRSKQFAGIEHIEEEGLSQMFELSKNGTDLIQFKPATIFNRDDDSKQSEITMLNEQRKKYENAVNRLKSLYLFGDAQLSESEYIVERQKLIDELNAIDKRLAELTADDCYSGMTEDEFNERASYFILADKLITDRPICYGNDIQPLDPSILRSFIRSVIKNITVSQGKVTSITFNNGITNKFIYSSEKFQDTDNGADSDDEI